MTTTVQRRAFDAERDACRYVMLLAGGRLLEVVGVRGSSRGSGASAVAVLDVAEDLPMDPLEELSEAVWIGLDQARRMLVVER